jgi:hypothetical protein
LIGGVAGDSRARSRGRERREQAAAPALDPGAARQHVARDQRVGERELDRRPAQLEVLVSKDFKVTAVNEMRHP